MPVQQISKTLLELHAACVSLAGNGILITGASNSGKSTAALSLIENHGALLVSDDRVLVETLPQRPPLASAPLQIAGFLEVRGVGLVPMPCAEQVPLNLWVHLVGRETPLERLPEKRRQILGTVPLPYTVLSPRQDGMPVTTLKICAALRLCDAGWETAPEPGPPISSQRDAAPTSLQ